MKSDAGSPKQHEEAGRRGTSCLHVALGVVLVAQCVVLLRMSVLPLAQRAWQVRYKDALERSAMIAFGPDFTRFIDFVRETVPSDAKLVVPSKSLDPVYGDIGLMQYFLRPRRIIDCPAGNDLAPCVRSLTGGLTYILAVPAFPPAAEAELYRDLKSFTQDRGVYVPRSPDAGLRRADPAASTPVTTSGILTVVVDVLVLGCLVGLGLIATRAILRDADVSLLAACGLPMGMAGLTWFVFLLSWMGVPLSSCAVLFTGLGLAAASLAFAGLGHKNRPQLPDARVSGRRQGSPFLTRVGWALCLLVVVGSLLLSVGRSYSTWDDMAAYAVQGFGVAHEGSVTAAQTWGPSAASYPLNVPISISAFHFVDGDVLPGSKLVFPMLFCSILLAGYRTWRIAGHTGIAAAALSLGLATTPVVFEHSTTGYTNLPFSAYIILGCLMVLEGAQRDHRRQELLGGMLLAGAVWTRPEGLLVAVVVVSLLLVLTARLRGNRGRAAVVLLPPAVVGVAWSVYGATSGVSGGMAGSLGTSIRSIAAGDLHLDAPYWTLRYLAGGLVDPSVWGFLLPMAGMLIILSFRSMKPLRLSVGLGMFAAGVAVGVCMFVFYYLVSFSGDLQFWLGTGVERMFLPAALLIWIGLGGLAALPRRDASFTSVRSA